MIENLQEFTASPRRIALVCMTPALDTNELSGVELPSYGIRRIHAAVIADPALHNAEVTLIDLECDDAAAFVEAIDLLNPT